MLQYKRNNAEGYFLTVQKLWAMLLDAVEVTQRKHAGSNVWEIEWSVCVLFNNQTYGTEEKHVSYSPRMGECGKIIGTEINETLAELFEKILEENGSEIFFSRRRASELSSFIIKDALKHIKSNTKHTANKLRLK